ncbi:M16 family metallopeptidase [Neorickettsia sennetsu]|uniref:Peptidase, M16 family n=1 Tax=Ehrlichia sennetsu (strain ATCC VR-367 / Miyayama) TaxID=222891 RepID=Q2GCL8_EHRS3|nr:pitrilysin family protein [Neorickettsia sennetsu]ABD46352.1 peptidase, M16 family [Neorickettsia sennetsu str. Miyayama]
MKQLLSCLLCVFSFFFLSLGHSKGDERIHYTLNNGLDVYLIRDTSLPIVSHVLLYKVGGASDPRGSSGLAHYLEHLMFRSSKNIPSISKEINGLRSLYNAFTSDYHTVYHQLFHRDKLEKVIRLEAERMRNLVISDEAAGLERKIVIEERKMRVDNKPVVKLEEEMMAAFYRSETSWNVIGWEEELVLFDAALAQRMYNACYRPSNAVLLILGDIDVDEAKKYVEKYYGVLTNSSSRWRSCFGRVVEPAHHSDIDVRMINDKTEDRALIYFFPAPNVSAEGHAAMLVASQVLAGGKTSVLGMELIHNLRLALNVSVDYDYLTFRKGIVEIIVTPLNADVKLEILEKSVSGVMSEVVKNGIGADDIEAAKMTLKVSLMEALDGFNARSISHVAALSVGADFDHFQKLAERVSAVTPEQINSAIMQLMNAKKVIGYLDK